MSKYQKYASCLNDAFRIARDQYTKAYNNLKSAEADLNAAKQLRPSDEWREGENADKVRRAEIAYIDAKNNFKKVEAEAWPKYKSTVKELTDELQAELKKESIADPDRLDDHGLKLLESGLMSADEYEAFMDRYDDNPTMLRFVSKYAREAADNLSGTEDALTRGRLYKVAQATQNGFSSVRRNWDSLVSIGETYSGQAHRNADPAFICNMSAKWDSEEPNSPQSAIENF